jgi:hypothetical protein
MAGNTVVLKPAQLTPWSGSEYGRIVAEETDIPAGVFNVVVSNANEAGAPTVKKTLLPRSRYDEGLAILRARWRTSRSATRGHRAICRGRRSARRNGRRCSD